jgi:hypothetical protein
MTNKILESVRNSVVLTWNLGLSVGEEILWNVQKPTKKVLVATDEW